MKATKHVYVLVTDLDHTADVQFHVWGSTLEEAFQNIAPCFANYVTDINTVDISPDKIMDFEAEGGHI